MSNVPRWNLDSIYKDLDCEEYKNDIAELERLIAKKEMLVADFEKSSFGDFLISYISLENELSALLKTLNAYSYVIYSTDTTNQKYMNNLNVMDDYSARCIKSYIGFSSILEKNKDKLECFFAENSEYIEYKYIFNEIIEDKLHQMSSEEEELAAKMSHTGGNAWSLLQEQLISNMRDSDGKTFNELRNDANEADCKLRKSSWKKEKELLQQNEIAFAASLNNLKGETLTLNKKRNWNQAVDKALFSSRLSKASLNSLIAAIEESLPVWRKYFMAKAKLLRKTGNTASVSAGTAEHKGIAFYDLFAPVENPSAEKSDSESLLSRKWTFEEAKNYVVKEFSSFSNEMGDFALKAFNDGWIDAEVRAGKVGGAYDEDFPKGHQSRILSNFTGVFSDVITLSHELGHAYHFSCLKEKAPVFYEYPMTLAETASTFAETVVKQDMLKLCTGFDRIRIMDLDLTDAGQVLVDILCRFYFEASVFEAKENSELTAADFCHLMQAAQEKSYGCGLNDEKDSDGNYTERHEYMWAVKSHYYIPDLDFYNFPYAFGQLFAAGLYALSLKEGSEFAGKYKVLLSNTGSSSCEAVCAQCGFDITKPDFWKAGIEMYAREIEEYCSYVENLKL